MWNTSLKRTDAPLRIGITGGIGSGKSLVCSLFRLMGAEVFEADVAAKEITSGDPDVVKKLVEHFGPDLYTSEGMLNRKKLAAIIFGDHQALQTVNAIVHPLVREAFVNWIPGTKGPYVLFEAAILFESGYYRQMDANILVTAPEEIRIGRVMERDGISRTEILSRMRNQFREEETVKLADFIIRNDGSELVIPQVLEINNKLKAYGNFR